MEEEEEEDNQEKGEKSLLVCELYSMDMEYPAQPVIPSFKA